MKGPVMQTVERILAPVAIAVSMVALALAWRALLCRDLPARARRARATVSQRRYEEEGQRDVEDE